MNAAPARDLNTADRASDDHPVVLPPRQRWRIHFSRAHDPSRRSHRDIVDPWLARLRGSGLPLVVSGGRLRSPLTFAAPLPAGMECRRELADLWLTDALALFRVRQALVDTLPEGIEIDGIIDVWVGAPALAAILRAADYCITLARHESLDQLDEVVRRFLDAQSFERDRARGSGTVRKDVRPLIGDVQLDRDAPALLVRTLFHPERGTGRPDDLLGALEELLGRPIERGVTVRERLVIVD